MKFTWFFVGGIAYIFFMVGIAVANVGTTPTVCQPYSPWLPVMMALVTVFPFVMGILSTKKES